MRFMLSQSLAQVPVKYMSVQCGTLPYIYIIYNIHDVTFVMHTKLATFSKLNTHTHTHTIDTMAHGCETMLYKFP